ncbi:FAD-dependent oxidoreductase [Thermodesulfobacteriota bacterium]
MTTWHEFYNKNGHGPAWPYPIKYGEDREVDADVLIIGGGIAGCWAAISAARKGVRVALVEKGATIRSGAGGPGCDHWCDVPANPLSKVDPDEWSRRVSNMPYACGIGRQIQCRENYDTLLELEKMGGKIRDIDDKHKGVEGRDDETRFMISPRYNPNHEHNVVIRVWGTTFKPALKKECQRLGVKIYDRIMATSLLTVDGLQGTRVVGATGLNNRTGEFMIFKAKSTILATSTGGSLWLLNTELGGYNTFLSRAISGDGTAMAWTAGAEFTMMESTQPLHLGTGFKHEWYTGAGDASYENVPPVDNNGKELPVVPEPGWGKKLNWEIMRTQWHGVREGVMSGEFELPFFGDFPAMKDIERETTWNMMLKEESTTKIIVDTYTEAGFDPAKNQLMMYQLIEGTSPPQWRSNGAGGLIIDWDLKTSLDGLYAAGTQIYSAADHSFAAATGRYAGRKAADYVMQVEDPVIAGDQVRLEKKRIYAPVSRDKGIDWKELHAGISKVMRYFCSEFKTDAILNMGIDSLKNIEENFLPELFALDPHKLMRGLEDMSMLSHAQLILHSSLARKASSKHLDFHRIDFPEYDPPEWNKFITVKQENGTVVTGEKPFNYAGDLKKNYEANNPDYTGVYAG